MAVLNQIALTLSAVLVGMMVGFKDRSLKHKGIEREGHQTAVITVNENGDVIEAISDVHDHISTKNGVSAESAKIHQDSENLSTLFDNAEKHFEKQSTQRDMAVFSARMKKAKRMRSDERVGSNGAGRATPKVVHGDPRVGIAARQARHTSTESGNSSFDRIHTKSYSAEEAIHDEVAHDHSHPHLALYFMAVAICAGCLTQWILDHFVPFLPYSSVLMVEGFVLGICEGMYIESHTVGGFRQRYLGGFLQSVIMWTEMDPHLLLYVFLPPLIFADCMTVQWHYFKRCFLQCLLLAGPGVVVSALTAAVFFRYALLWMDYVPVAWSWAKCWTVGSILAMTDPVAVVAILKSSGVSPKLTTLISGESLLNDGSALVIFNICNALAKDTKGALEEIHVYNKYEMDVVDYFKYFARLSAGGPAVGVVFGVIFVYFIGKAYKTTIHMNGVVQIGLTLSCAYSSFFVGEHVLGVSGVLACVVSGLVVGVVGTPQFCDPHGMHNAWHTLDWLLCTLIFLTSGVIGGNIFYSGQFTPRFYGFVVLCWVVLVVLGRAALMLLFFPALSRIGYGLSWKSAVVASWGGLRGAVGIGLAMMVRSELHAIDQIKKGDSILAIATGVAWLTSTVNGMTMGRLLKYLKLIESKEKVELFAQIRKQIEKQVKRSIEDAISEIPDDKSSEDLVKIRSLIHIMCGVDPPEDQQSLDGVPQQSREYATQTSFKSSMLVREIFLYIVKVAYQEQCKSGMLPVKGSNTMFMVLQESVDVGLDDLNCLGDLDVVLEHLGGSSWWLKFWDTMKVWTGGVSVEYPHSKCYMLLSFIQAHRQAQKMISMYAHDYDDVVVQESMAEITRAQAELRKLGNDVHAEVTATRISRLVLAKQVHYIEHLNSGGVIDSSQAHDLMEDVEHRMDRARSQPHLHSLLSVE